MEKLHIFSNHTSALHPKLCYNDTNHCDLLHYLSVIAKFLRSVVYLFVAFDND